MCHCLKKDIALYGRWDYGEQRIPGPMYKYVTKGQNV